MPILLTSLIIIIPERDGIKLAVFKPQFGMITIHFLISIDDKITVCIG